jgi:hypothetical protein
MNISVISFQGIYSLHSSNPRILLIVSVPNTIIIFEPFDLAHIHEGIFNTTRVNKT